MSEHETKSKIIIKGRVVNEIGRPISGARVIYDGTETLTLFDGAFQFELEKPENHLVEIIIEGYKKQKKQIELKEFESDVLEFQLEPDIGNSRIYGYVLDKKTNRPIMKGGTVYLYRPTSNQKKMIDPNSGFYEFNNLPLGTYNIWTSVLEYQEQKMTITLEESEEAKKNFLLDKEKKEEVPWG